MANPEHVLWGEDEIEKKVPGDIGLCGFAWASWFLARASPCSLTLETGSWIPCLSTINPGALTNTGGFLELLSLTLDVPEEKLQTEWERHSPGAGDWFLATGSGQQDSSATGGYSDRIQAEPGARVGV